MFSGGGNYLPPLFCCAGPSGCVKITNRMSEKYKVPSLEEMLAAGLHFGHQRRRWHPKIAPYLFAATGKVHVFDLPQTREKLAEACLFLEKEARQGRKIIFVGTKRQAQNLIAEAAQGCGALFVNRRWLGGTLTNFDSIRKNLDRLTELTAGLAGEAFSRYTKKERLLLTREKEKLEGTIGGLQGLAGLPAALVVVDIKRERTAVREAQRKNVPVVALVDSNTDPSTVAYPVPGNDDAMKAVALVLQCLAEAVKTGYREWALKEKTEDLPRRQAGGGERTNDRGMKTEGGLKDLKLSKRALNALGQAGVADVAQLKRLSRDDLLGIGGLGEKSVEEILLKIK